MYAYRIAIAKCIVLSVQTLTTNDYQFLKGKLVDLYSRVARALIMAGRWYEINDFINDYMKRRNKERTEAISKFDLEEFFKRKRINICDSNFIMSMLKGRKQNILELSS